MAHPWGPQPKPDELRIGIPFPRVHLEVEGMRHSIITAIANTNREIEEYLEAEIPRAIEAFDWKGELDAMVRGVLHIAIQKAVDEYFLRREGWEMVNDIVKNYVYTTFAKKAPDAQPGS